MRDRRDQLILAIEEISPRAPMTKCIAPTELDMAEDASLFRPTALTPLNLFCSWPLP
jgi:hypothetical protein